MDPVTKSTADSAKTAVDLAIGLIGQMALWLGVMRVLEEAGLMRALARLLAPIMRRLFPEIPEDHPAMGAMIMNLAANMMGLANAATPFGLKAMLELDRLNDRKGVATSSMALFLAINTSGVAVLPLGVVAMRASMGAKDVTGIVLPSILATACSTVAAIIVCKLVERLRVFAVDRYPATTGQEQAPVKGLDAAEALAKKALAPIHWRSAIAYAIFGVLIAAVLREMWFQGGDLHAIGSAGKRVLSSWMLPTIIVVVALVGFARGVKVYEAVVAGAKEGFNVCVMIIPFLVAILVAIGMFRASGAMGYLVSVTAPITSLVGFPPEALPMVFIRPLSGNGALAVLVDTMKTHGPDSFVSFLVSVMSGSTETTFYVLALYFGSVGVRATRHTVIPCLAADVTGFTAAFIFSRIFY
jgi:spore maturation protein SpmA